MLRYLKTDPVYASTLKEVWLWNDFFARDSFGGKDVGIDLVAETADGEFWAIQCKCYRPDARIDKPAVDTFLSTSGKTFPDREGKKVRFSNRLWLDTTENGFNREAENSLKNQDPECHRVGLSELGNAKVDWERLDRGSAGEKARAKKKSPREHQLEAIEKVHEYFAVKGHDRGKLIMACGTGKTYTSLCIAEKETGGRGTVLFLVPSIALLSQTLREWAADAKDPVKPICICSDPSVSRAAKRSDESEGGGFSVTDLALPASTDVRTIVRQLELARGKKNGMTVVFSTYQSIDVVISAQKKMGADFEFDMIVCDEAHRTTGVKISGEDESNFVKVHDAKVLRAKRRVYMTATPRLYSESSKKKAEEHSIEICSMDDASKFGDEMYRIGFGDAVQKQLLCDYKVLVLTIDPRAMTENLQLSLETDNGEMLSDDEAKLVGCFNALAKITLVDDRLLKETDPQPMKRAVAFCRTIKDSKALSKTINDLQAKCYDNLRPAAKKESVRAESKHIDGGMGASAREDCLSWLKAEIPEGQCRILNNVRCLSEGVDVPSLDAVLFLSARDSEVDVVQSVGRVMRTAPGKKYGYIIIPVLVPFSERPEEALDKNNRFKVVWKILNALRAHDDRFNAMVNQISLGKPEPGKSRTRDRIGVSPGTNPGVESLSPADKEKHKALQTELELKFQELQGAIYAKMVEKVGSRRYWEDWAKDVADIAKRHEDRIRRLISEDGKPKREFDRFLAALQKNLNPGVDSEQAIEMLSQHLITRPVFEALFEGYDFAASNPVSCSMQRVINLVESTSEDVDKRSLEKFYRSVKLRAEGIESAEGRQKIIVELYDKFFRSALPKTVQQLGIVYTPVECVDFIIRSVDEVLRQEFGRKLSDADVNIIDPFTGTGTFMTRLIQSGLISRADLPRKFSGELKANEIVLLAYYIASVNIENAYHDAMGQKTFTAFKGICLTDSFQLGERSEQADFGEDVFPVNGPRARAQRKAPIQVVIGNPPYSVGQKSANDNARNRKYPDLDAQIERFYAEGSSATNKNSLYDSYIRAFRWATDRIDPKSGGVIGFITNGSWIDGNAMDGFRKSLEREFGKIYVFNLRGNARTQGELRRKERDNVFGQGTRTPVCITVLVKPPASAARPGARAAIRYADIGDYLSREEKLQRIRDARSMSRLPMRTLRPNAHGDWINLRNEDFGRWDPIEPEKKFDGQGKSWFVVNSNGAKTQRDSWSYNSSKEKVENAAKESIGIYNRTLKELRDGKISKPDFETKKISWTSAVLDDLKRGSKYDFSEAEIRDAFYRPFFRQHMLWYKPLVERRYQIPRLFPELNSENLVICVSGVGVTKDFSCIITDVLPDLELIGKSQCFPLYYYEAPDYSDMFAPKEKYVRRCAVSEFILQKAQRQYSDKKVSREDIFYYVYGFLHLPAYRRAFAPDLKKMLPRIPLVDSAETFYAFSRAGRALARVHLNYETAEPYRALVVSTKSASADLPLFGRSAADPRTLYSAEPPEILYRVSQMRFAKAGKERDRSRIVYNDFLTVANIPAEAYEYVVNGKSAIEWIMERYAVTTDKASGIVNDPNDWAKEHGEPSYIFDLLLRVITVSLETVKIVKALPAVKF